VSDSWHGAGIVMLIGIVLGFSSATASASAPTIFQDNGTAAALASALNGALMEATITLTASNGTWLAAIIAEAVGWAGRRARNQ